MPEQSKILTLLRTFNPWWIDGAAPSGMLPELHRMAYFQAMKLLRMRDLRRAVVLSGPRRVGKTTVAYQIIDRLLGDGVDPKNIVYLSLEHPELKGAPLDALLDLYDSQIGVSSGRRYVFLDELQYLDQPMTWLKLLVDRRPTWRIVATGSASLVLQKKDRESGVGRTVTVEVPTLSFYEFVQLRGISVQGLPKLIPPTQIGTLPAHQRHEILSRLKPLRRELATYFLLGGFPETAKSSDVYYAQRVLREDIVGKVMRQDMTTFYGIRKLNELERLFLYVCQNNGGVINVDTLSRELGVKRPTLNSFLSALEGAHLLRSLRLFDTTGKKFLKGNAKWYTVDASMRNAALLRGEEVLTNDAEMGLAVVESAVINHLASFSYDLAPTLGYWRNRKKLEVDLVVGVPNKRNVAVVVKYRDAVTLQEDEGIYDYLRGNPESVGIVVCRDAEDFEIRHSPGGKEPAQVTLIPAYVFLYLLGKFEYERAVEGAESLA